VTDAWVQTGEERRPLALPPGLSVRVVVPPARPDAPNPLAVVAQALDRPHGAEPLIDVARRAKHATIVVPDPTRPSSAAVYLLPAIARLARAGLGPERIRVVMARGVHRAATRAQVAEIVGTQVMDALYTVQSAPETGDLNVSIGEDPEIGDVRIHRVVAEADLVLLTGAVQPHHLAGFGGGAKALVPGVAERPTVLAAHRLTLRTVVRPDGSVRSLAGDAGPNPFRDALLRVARGLGRCFLLNVVLGDGGGIAAAAAGEVGEAHAAAVEAWRAGREDVVPEPADLVIAGVAAPRDTDLIQAHKTLLVAAAWARPKAPIVLVARAPNGPGHPQLLPWFEIRKATNHLAALRREFHPYGLTAYSIRRIAAEHPVHLVTQTSPDLVRPMGLLPFSDVDAAIGHALREHAPQTCVVLPG
jgi:nickel-dependent lactate racemase